MILDASASKYEHAVGSWIERHEKLPPGSVMWIDFVGLDGCDTCGHGSGAALDYVCEVDGKRKTGQVLLEHPLSPGQFIAECAALVAEIDREGARG